MKQLLSIVAMSIDAGNNDLGSRRGVALAYAVGVKCELVAREVPAAAKEGGKQR